MDEVINIQQKLNDNTTAIKVDESVINLRLNFTVTQPKLQKL
jgi:hypothetical protein